MIETKIVNSMDEAKENDIVYDIDLALELTADFLKRSTNLKKEFKRLTKKMNGKDPAGQQKKVLKFAKDKLFGIWTITFTEKFLTNNELDYLEEDALLHYILGIFITGNSEEKKFKENREKIIAKTIYELLQRSMSKRAEADIEPQKPTISPSDAQIILANTNTKLFLKDNQGA